ncbi:folic acid synthesis protein, partial [Teratosphaeria destructans]
PGLALLTDDPNQSTGLARPPGRPTARSPLAIEVLPFHDLRRRRRSRSGSRWPLIARKVGARITNIHCSGTATDLFVAERLEKLTTTVSSAGLSWAFDVARRYFQSPDCASIDGVVLEARLDWAAPLDYVDQRNIGLLALKRLHPRDAGPLITLTLPPYTPQKVHLTKPAGQSEASIAVALTVRGAAAESALERGVPASPPTVCEEMMWLTESAHRTIQSVLASMRFDSLAQASKFLSKALLRTLKISDDAGDIVDLLLTCKGTADLGEDVACRASCDEITVATTTTNDAPEIPLIASETGTQDRSSLSGKAGKLAYGNAAGQSDSEMSSAMLEDKGFLRALNRNASRRRISALVGSRSRILEERTGFRTYALTLSFADAEYKAVAELPDNEIASRIHSSFERGTADMHLVHHEIMMQLAENFQGVKQIMLQLHGAGQFQIYLRYSPVDTGNVLVSALFHNTHPFSKPNDARSRLQTRIELSGQATKDRPGQEHHGNLYNSFATTRSRMLDLVTPSLYHSVQRQQYQPWAEAAALTILNCEWLSRFMQTVSVRIAETNQGVVGTARAVRDADGRVTLENEHDIHAKSPATTPYGEEGNKSELLDGLQDEDCGPSEVVSSGVEPDGSVLTSHLQLSHSTLTKFPTGGMRFEIELPEQFPGFALKPPGPNMTFQLLWSRPDQGVLSLTTEEIVARFAPVLKSTVGSGTSWLCGVTSRLLHLFPGVSACVVRLRWEKAAGQSDWLSTKFGFRMADSQKPPSAGLVFDRGLFRLANGAAVVKVTLSGQHETATSLDPGDWADALQSLQKEVHCVVQGMLASADVYSDLRSLTESIASKLAGHVSSPFLNVVESARVLVQPQLSGSPTHAATAIQMPMPVSEGGVILALGSNVGNRLEALELACNTIDADPAMKIIRTSMLYETEPMYVKDQDRFLNGVCEIETTYRPMELLDRLQDIENRLGRVKGIDKGPRNIDLDILLYRQMAFRNDRLRIPHPLIPEREFVLRPLADIEPGFWFWARAPVSWYLANAAGQGLPMFPQTPLGPSGEVITAQDPRRKTRIMSILNTTPDSFSDGGLIPVTDRGALRDLIAAQIADGATIIDVGGQSSRPNAPDVSAEEEIRRILPAIEAFNALPEETRSGVAISIDTYRAAVAEAGINAGAHIVNDISAGTLDADMLSTVARLGCTYVMMHMRGTPATMQDEVNTDYEAGGGLIESVASELRARVDAAQAAGVRRWRMILDPGIGFAKTQDQNLELLRRMPELVDHPKLRGVPWLVGSSRKGFIGRITGVTEAKERTWGTAATVTTAVRGGADIVRVHDVKEMAQVVKMADAMYRV